MQPPWAPKSDMTIVWVLTSAIAAWRRRMQARRAAAATDGLKDALLALALQRASVGGAPIPPLPDGPITDACFTYLKEPRVAAYLASCFDTEAKAVAFFEAFAAATDPASAPDINTIIAAVAAASASTIATHRDVSRRFSEHGESWRFSEHGESMRLSEHDESWRFGDESRRFSTLSDDLASVDAAAIKVDRIRPDDLTA